MPTKIHSIEKQYPKQTVLASTPTIPRPTMSEYDLNSDNDSHGRVPVLYGTTGDACGTCSSTTVPLYDLSCHESDDFYCCDCLTKTWYVAANDLVPCPACCQDCNFMPLQPIEEWHGLNRHFRDREQLGKMRQQPDVMNNLMGFTADEAAVFLEQLYVLVEEQITDPVLLGNSPYYQVPETGSTTATLIKNPFYGRLIDQLVHVPKMMTSPLELEEDLIELLKHIVVDFTKYKHGYSLHVSGVDVDDDDDVLHQAITKYPDINEMRDNWIGIIRLWVEMLACRHLERLAPAEGGAAERSRRPSVLEIGVDTWTL
jgi:hypothetical protein